MTSKGRARQASIALRLGAMRHERRFVRALRGILGGVHDLMVKYVHADTRADTVGKPTGNPTADADMVLQTVLPQLGPKVDVAHRNLSNGLLHNYKSSMKAILPIGFDKLPSHVQARAYLARNESIKLVENAARVYTQQVKEIFSNPDETLGTRWEDLRDQLLERGDVSESRAELIARDQTLKLNGAINQSHQESLGIDSYTWSTSKDERVREEHADLEGETFSWATPPDVGHPGEDFQCRCIAIPIVDLSDLE